jgi:hypothetical protein
VALLWSRCFGSITLPKGRSSPCSSVHGFYCRLAPGGSEEDPNAAIGLQQERERQSI